MRSISAAYEALFTARGARSVRHRVQVKDAGGTFRDLSTYPTRNLCHSVRWKEGVDDPGMVADITLKRAFGLISLAPLMESSPLNRAWAYPGTYAALIAYGREVKIEWAVMPERVAPSSGDWVLGFHGYIDTINPTGGFVKLTCRGLQARIMDAQIKEERVYAYANPADGDATKGLLVWRPRTAFPLNSLILPTEAKRNGHFFKVTAIGSAPNQTAGEEPTYPTSGTVASGDLTLTEVGTTTSVTGTDVETVIQQLLNDNMASPPTLVTPSSPGWAIRVYKQDRVMTWAAIRTLADQIGWDLRYVWDSGTSTFKLKLLEVPRTKTTPDRTFGPGQRYKLSKLELDIAGIRTRIRGIYSNSQLLEAGKYPIRTTIEVVNATMESAIGHERFMEIAEDEHSNIDTNTEMTRMLNAVLDDLSSPRAEQDCELPFFPFTELSDLYRFSADGVNYTSDQDLAVVSYEHSITPKRARTRLSCRGKPASGYERWLTQAAGVNDEWHQVDVLSAADQVDITPSAVVGGTKFDIVTTQGQHKNALPIHWEIHVSKTAGFTPDDTTLKAQGAVQNLVVPELIGGDTYYYQGVPYGFNKGRIVRGQASEEASFVAGRASSGHIHSGIALGDYPLNGGFETRLNAAGLPDHWALYSGSYSTNVEVMTDGNGLSGRHYLRLKNGGVRSAIFPIIQEANESSRRGSLYRFHWWRKAGSSASAYSALIRLLDNADGEVVVLTISSSMPVDKAGHWVLEELFVRLKEGDASARGLQLQISGGGTSANQQIDIDEVRCQFLGTPWYEVGDTTYFTNNYEAVPGFSNSWVNYDASTEVKAAFRKDQFGRVELKGLIKSGTVTAAAFTLPAGYRPPRTMRFAVPSNALFGIVDVQANGQVVPQVGSNVWFDLSSIRFMTTHLATTTS